MRRAVLALSALVAVAAPGRADPPATHGTWDATAESGASIDTNVERVESGCPTGDPTCPLTPRSAPVLRLGAGLTGHGRVAGGGYALAMSALARIVSDGDTNQQIEQHDQVTENVMLLAGDLRWLHQLGSRPVALGFDAVAADALPMDYTLGDRTFSNVGGDALVSVHDGEDHRLVLALGGRSFEYKPDHDFDWSGPTASANLDLVLWQTADRTRSLELATSLGFEARAYDASAYATACPPGAKPDPMCFAPTRIARRDRFSRAGVELTWAGRQVVSVGYQLIVIDSNSFGESFVRHRATASVTTALPWGLYGTLIGILEIDRYSDGLILATDPVHADFTNIDDENRSSLQAHLAKSVSAGWSIEARAAVWRNIGASSSELDFHRELAYVGLLYAR